MIYGDDFVTDLYRPDPGQWTLRLAAHILRFSQKESIDHPAGFGSLMQWQALKMVRVLQLHYSSGVPTIGRFEVLQNYIQNVPDFPKKSFGGTISS